MELARAKRMRKRRQTAPPKMSSLPECNSSPRSAPRQPIVSMRYTPDRHSDPAPNDRGRYRIDISLVTTHRASVNTEFQTTSAIV